MEIAERVLKHDLGLTSEQFEGMYVLWQVGADLETLADEIDRSSHMLGWYFLMRSAGEGTRIAQWPVPTVHYDDPNQPTI